MILTIRLISHPQIRSAWFSAQLGCARVKSPSSTFSYILTIIADMVLLLIILTGLLVLRLGGGGTFGLTRILWKQVRKFSIRLRRDSFNLLIFLFFRKRGSFGSSLPFLLRFHY
jgi:hypothetical protein